LLGSSKHFLQQPVKGFLLLLLLHHLLLLLLLPLLLPLLLQQLIQVHLLLQLVAFLPQLLLLLPVLWLYHGHPLLSIITVQQASCDPVRHPTCCCCCCCPSNPSCKQTEAQVKPITLAAGGAAADTQQGHGALTCSCCCCCCWCW
jgi:hypothetical protein